jgi:hypothetical protein
MGGGDQSEALVEVTSHLGFDESQANRLSGLLGNDGGEGPDPARVDLRRVVLGGTAGETSQECESGCHNPDHARHQQFPCAEMKKWLLLPQGVCCVKVGRKQA